MKHQLAVVILGLGVLVPAWGATAGAVKPPTRRTPVCPECKAVQVAEVPISRWDDDGAVTGYTRAVHMCPHCQDAITTLLKEGKFRHECSRCKKESTTCPTEHRVL